MEEMEAEKLKREAAEKLQREREAKLKTDFNVPQEQWQKDKSAIDEKVKAEQQAEAAKAAKEAEEKAAKLDAMRE